MKTEKQKTSEQGSSTAQAHEGKKKILLKLFYEERKTSEQGGNTQTAHAHVFRLRRVVDIVMLPRFLVASPRVGGARGGAAEPADVAPLRGRRLMLAYAREVRARNSRHIISVSGRLASAAVFGLEARCSSMVARRTRKNADMCSDEMLNSTWDAARCRTTC